MSFTKLLQPKQNPFGLYIYSHKDSSLSLKLYSQEKLSQSKLSNFKGEPMAQLNAVIKKLKKKQKIKNEDISDMYNEKCASLCEKIENNKLENIGVDSSTSLISGNKGKKNTNKKNSIMGNGLSRNIFSVRNNSRNNNTKGKKKRS